jgi:hypothetical protein
VVAAYCLPDRGFGSVCIMAENRPCKVSGKNEVTQYPGLWILEWLLTSIAESRIIVYILYFKEQKREQRSPKLLVNSGQARGIDVR